MNSFKLTISRHGLPQIKLFDVWFTDELNGIYCTGMIRSFNKTITGDVSICLLIKNRKGNIISVEEGKLYGKPENSAVPFEIKANLNPNLPTEIKYIELLTFEKEKKLTPPHLESESGSYCASA